MYPRVWCNVAMTISSQSHQLRTTVHVVLLAVCIAALQENMMSLKGNTKNSVQSFPLLVQTTVMQEVSFVKTWTNTGRNVLLR